MRVDIAEMDWTEDEGYIARETTRDVDLAECFPDDPDGLADAERQFAEYGNASVGGGAAPLFILTPAGSIR